MKNLLRPICILALMIVIGGTFAILFAAIAKAKYLQPQPDPVCIKTGVIAEITSASKNAIHFKTEDGEHGYKKPENVWLNRGDTVCVLWDIPFSVKSGEPE